MICWLIDKVVGIWKPVLTKDKVRAIAKQECEKRGYPWLEPVSVHRRLTYFYVWTNAMNKGANIVIDINKFTGEVIRITHIRY